MSGFDCSISAAVAFPGRPSLTATICSPGLRGDHPLPAACCDPCGAAHEGDPVAEAVRLGKVCGDQIRPADALRLGVTATAEGSDQTDAIRHDEGGGLHHRAECRATPGQHDHLGVECDDHSRVRRRV